MKKPAKAERLILTRRGVEALEKLVVELESCRKFLQSIWYKDAKIPHGRW